MTTPYTVTPYDDNGRSHYLELEQTLSPQCSRMAVKLQWLLAHRGPTLKEPHAKHIEGPIWELRELCDGGALRIYYFQSGKIFYLTCGEVKKRDRTSLTKVAYAKACYERHKAAQQS